MSDLEIKLSFAEALSALAMTRDYTRLRREWKRPEDALLAYFYHHLDTALRDAAREDEEGFQNAISLVTLPIYDDTEED